MATIKTTSVDSKKKPVLIKKAKPAQDTTLIDSKEVPQVTPTPAPTIEKKKRPQNPIWKAANITAKKLGETELKITSLLYRIIKAIGIEQVDLLIQEAQNIHKGEGMLTTNKERCRSAGGIFFVITKRFMGATAFNKVAKPRRPKQQLEVESNNKDSAEKPTSINNNVVQTESLDEMDRANSK